MGIRPLPTEVRNALRSGVVITNATQCVIELVLNSLDAGAKCIAIRVDLIAQKLQIVDNGCGIDKESLDLIGLRYMTSKCHSLVDLQNHIGQFGYRGEALASLRNVSKLLVIESRTADSHETFRKVFSEGKAREAVLSGAQRPSRGTTVTVYDFMYNMPVRRHRIKDALNLEEIKIIIEATALTHPAVAFSLRNDVNGSMILKTHKTCDTLKTFAYLFGNTLSQTLNHVTHSLGSFKVYGYISCESHTQKNLQFIYVNKRLVYKTKLHKVVNAILSKSSIIYSNHLRTPLNSKQRSSGNWLTFTPPPKREQYHVFLLNIKCAHSEYDMCCEPKKTLIEFRNWKSVLKCLEETVTNFLKHKHLVKTDIREGNNSKSELEPILRETKICKGATPQSHILKTDINCIDQVRDDSSVMHVGRTIRGQLVYRQNENATTNRDSHVIDILHVESRTNKNTHINNKGFSLNDAVTSVKLSHNHTYTSKTKSYGQEFSATTYWTEDPFFTPSNTKIDKVRQNAIALSSNDMETLTEDPFGYDVKDTKIVQTYKRFSNVDESTVALLTPKQSRKSTHFSNRNRKICFPLFPNPEKYPLYLGLKDVMKGILLRTMQKFAIKSSAKNKACIQSTGSRPTLLKITERKLSVNQTVKFRKKFVKKGNLTNERIFKNSSVKCSSSNMTQSPYFEFVPKIVTYNEAQGKVVRNLCSPYFFNHGSFQSKIVLKSSAPGNREILPVNRSPYFSSNHITLQNTVKNARQKWNRQQLFIEHPSVHSQEIGPVITKDTHWGPTPQPYHQYRTAIVPNGVKNSLYQSQHGITLDNSLDRMMHYHSTSRPSISDVFSNALSYKNPIIFPNQTLSVLKKSSRNYMTSADLICTLEDVRRNIRRDYDVTFEQKVLAPSRPSVRWGNVQCYSAGSDRVRHLESPHSNDMACRDWPGRPQVEEMDTFSPQDVSDTACRVCDKYSYNTRHPCADIREDGQDPRSSAISDFAVDSQRRFSTFEDICANSHSSMMQIMKSCREATDKHTHILSPSTIGSFDTREDGCSEMIRFGYKPKQNCIQNSISEFLSVCKKSSYVEHHKPCLQSFLENKEYESTNDRIDLALDEYFSNVAREKRCRDNTDYNPSKRVRLDENYDGHMAYDGELTLTEISHVNDIHNQSNDFLTDASCLCEVVLQDSPLENEPSIQPHVSPSPTTEGNVVNLTPSKNDGNCVTRIEELQYDSCNKESVPSQVVGLLECTSAENDFLRQVKESCQVDAARKCSQDEDILLEYEGKVLTSEEIDNNTPNNRAEWVQRLDADGNKFFVHIRTGMTSFEPSAPISDNQCYSMTKRYDFLPKGISPVLKEKTSGPPTELSPGSRDAVHKVVSDVASSNDELSLIKWRDDQPKCEDLIKLLLDDAEKRMEFCEASVPNAYVDGRNAVKVFNLLTSYSFTKEIFTSIKILGQLDNKFIVTLVAMERATSPHLIVLFDQHAVDERIRLEKLLEDYLEVDSDHRFKSCLLDTAITISLLPQDVRIALSFELEFERIGLKYTKRDESSLVVTSVPSCVKSRESREQLSRRQEVLESVVGALVKEVAGALILGNGIGPRIPTTLQAVINSEACKGAIKFGDPLSPVACKEMLEKLAKCDLPFQCAHGRPSLVPIADMDQMHRQQTNDMDFKPNYMIMKKYLRE